MKEREQRQEDFTKGEFALNLVLSIALIAATAGVLHSYGEQVKELRQKCVAEQIIDVIGNPGTNFRLEVKNPCDVFIASRKVREAKGYKDFVLGQFTPKGGW